MDVRGPGRRLDLALRRVGIAEADVLLDGAMEEEGVLVHHRDHRADLREGERPEIVTAEPDSARLRIVESEQQPHDRGFPAAGAADDADALAGVDLEVEPVVHATARTGVAEPHGIEGDTGDERPCERRRGRVRHHRSTVENLIDALGRRHADHSLVQDGTELAHRPEDLDAEHEDDQQRGQRHRARIDPHRAQRQRCRGAAGDRAVGDAARHHVAAEHPHGAPEEIARLPLELVGSRLALAEGFQRRQALDRIQELRREGGIGLLPRERLRGLPLVPDRRAEKRHHREGQHHRRHRQVDERHPRKDQQRRQQRDQELRQELAEIGLELLHAVDQRERDGAGSARTHRGGTQGRDPVVDRAAQPLLHARRGLVRDHRAPMLEHAAERIHRCDAGYRPGERADVVAREDLADEPTEQPQPRHAEPNRDQTDEDRPQDAQAYPLGEHPQTPLEMHGAPSTTQNIGAEAGGVVTAI